MYCKQCHSKIAKNIINCPVCGFNNSNDFEMGKTTELDLAAINGHREPPNKNKGNPKIVMYVAILLILSTLGINYLVLNSKGNSEIVYTTTTTKEVVNTKEFKVGNLKFYYTLDFDAVDNRLYLIDDQDINIEFNVIDTNTYYEIINDNEILDTLLNDIEAKTYANDNNYGYLLDINETKYHIVINYDDKITEEVQASINKILKSIIIK